MEAPVARAAGPPRSSSQYQRLNTMTLVSQMAAPVARRTVAVSCFAPLRMPSTNSITASRLSTVMMRMSTRVSRRSTADRRSIRPGSPTTSASEESELDSREQVGRLHDVTVRENELEHDRDQDTGHHRPASLAAGRLLPGATRRHRGPVSGREWVRGPLGVGHRIGHDTIVARSSPTAGASGDTFRRSLGGDGTRPLQFAAATIGYGGRREADPQEEVPMSPTVLFIIAAVIAVIGLIVLIGGSWLWGIILLIVAALVGPGGYSIFRRRSAYGARGGLHRRLVPHVQEDQAQEGAHAPLQGQSREAPEHGALSNAMLIPPPPTRREAVVELLHGREVPDPVSLVGGRRLAGGRRVGGGAERPDQGGARCLSRPEGLVGPAGHPAGAARFDGRYTCRGRSGVLTGTGRRPEAVHARRPRPAGEAAGRARVLVDPAALVADATAAIDWYHPSPDGELVAYGVSEGGDERSVLRVLEVSTGQHRADEIPDTRAASVAWLPGNHAFFYARYPADDEYNRRIFRHRLGRPWTEDELVWGDLPTPETWADVTTSPDGRFTLVTAMVGWSRTDLHLRHEATGEWRTLISGVDVTTQARFDGDRLVAVTTLDALRPRRGHPAGRRGGGVGVGDAGTRRRRCHAARRASGRRPAGGHDDGLHGARRAARTGRRAGGRARAPRAVLRGGPRSVTGWRDRLLAAGGLHPSRQPLPVGRW